MKIVIINNIFKSLSPKLNIILILNILAKNFFSKKKY